MHSSVFNNGKKIPYLQETSKQIILTYKVSAVSLPQVKFFKDRDLFYATYVSPGGSDECFDLEGLSSPSSEKDKIFGRIFQGMSGGPIFFERDGDYILGGVISQAYSPLLIPLLKDLQNDKKPLIQKKAKKFLKQYEKVLMSTYDAYQGFSKEDFKNIQELMLIKNNSAKEEK